MEPINTQLFRSWPVQCFLADVSGRIQGWRRVDGSGWSGGPGGSGVSGGIDPVTQAGIDAGNAATQEQSNQDIRDAANQISGAAAVN
jgi:hypothetical protein